VPTRAQLLALPTPTKENRFCFVLRDTFSCPLCSAPARSGAVLTLSPVRRNGRVGRAGGCSAHKAGGQQPAPRPIVLAPPSAAPPTFPGPWDRAAVEIRLDRATLQEWLAEGSAESPSSLLLPVNFEIVASFGLSSVLGMEQPGNPAKLCSAYRMRLI
jgi:hypothetical protein